MYVDRREKPSDFSRRWPHDDYHSNLEFRVDGYTLDYVEVDDGCTVAMLDYGETLVSLSGPNELVRILMWRNHIRWNDVRQYVSLLLPNMRSYFRIDV